MEWRELILDGYERIPRELAEILKDLTQEELDWQPDPAGNSIGWTVWHLARVQDAQIADLAGEEQVYLKNGWYNRFRRKADPSDTGFGDTPQEVAVFRSPEVKVLMEYIQASVEQSRRYILTLSPDGLDRKLDEPWFQPLPTVGVRLVSILADGHQHTGEASYIRGLRKAREEK